MRREHGSRSAGIRPISAVTDADVATVRVLAFARARELLGAAEFPETLAADSTLDDLWASLAARCPALTPLRRSTRMALNGRLAEGNERLVSGDEVALLPPAGGG